MKKELAAIFLGASLLYGCSTKMGVFENHPVKYSDVPFSDELTIYSLENEGYIKFIDGIWGEPEDGRIDEITLVDVKKGDSLESLANLEAGQKILKAFLDKSK